jgi:dienelactone hydrolase
MGMRRTVLAVLSVLLTVVAGSSSGGVAQTPPRQSDEALAREIISNFAARKFDAVEARFGAQLAAALPIEKLPASWDSAIAQFGDFVAIESVRSEQVQGFTLVRVTCKFSRMEAVFDMPFDGQQHLVGLHGAPVAAPWIAPDYAKEDSFTERSVTVGSAPWQLPGTLTLPKGTGPFAAVVLVHGSGSAAGDQDESIGSNKGFKDLAWGLASRGVAVLRYVKRTRQYGAQIAANPAGLTVRQETEEDARAAVAVLTTLPEIDAKHIYVAGHSLGGYLGPRIAAGDPQISGLILLAGSTRPLEDMVVEQTRFQVSASGAITPEGQMAIDRAEAEKKAIDDPNLKPGMMVQFLGSPTPAEYFLDLRGYNPPQLAASLRIPVLILQGEKDVQVSMVDFDNWKKALEGKSSVTLKAYPTLNHLFMPVGGSPTGKEYGTTNHILPEVVEDIATWVKKQAATAPAK